jgi:hypothetical protein
MIRQFLRRRIRTVRIVLRLPLADMGLLLEALALLALARMAVLLLPFRWVARVLGKQEAQTPEQEVAAKDWQARRIGAMVRDTARNVLWTSKCLDQALAAKVMLARRGIATTVYFGVNVDEQGQLAAHAWLRSGTRYVTGGKIRDRYTVINTFADEGA